MTQTEWLAQIEECGGDMSQEALINLLFKDGPNAIYSETVNQMHVVQNGMYNYLTGLFPARVWNDWQGTTEIGQQYHSAYVPFDMSIFQRSMQICDPASQNECHTDYCNIPRGGVSYLPELEMYKTGFKTEPVCIANIRTSKKALQIAEMLIKERFAVDEQVMNIFYTMALIRMLGHKWVLEYKTDPTTGDVVPVSNVNPYNILNGFQYNYLNPLFPTVGDITNIMPLDLRFMEMFGRALVNTKNPNSIATGPRGAPIYELWAPNDVYQQEVIDNPEWLERMKYTMPAKLLPGYSLDTNGEREIIGNFAFRQNANLPRLAESTKGGLTVVQPMMNVPVDGGNRALHNTREWDNAPFLMMCAIGKGIGEILSRPTLSTGVEGRPIQPITGSGDWIYRNDYNQVCNEDLNMPHFRKRYEMGFRLLNGDAGWGMIGRSKKFRLRPINTCDLNPIFAIAPVESDCSILTIGCNPLNQRVSNNILEFDRVRTIVCSSAVCGDDTIYRLMFRRENIDSITLDQNPLSPCVCGDDVTVIIGNAAGVETRQAAATLLEYMRPNMVNPGPIWFAQLEASLDAGECIQGVVCNDETLTLGKVVSCVDQSIDPSLAGNAIKVILDSLLSCVVGATVHVHYYDVDHVSLGSLAGTIAAEDRQLFQYTITSAVSGFKCAMYEDGTTMEVTCG